MNRGIKLFIAGEEVDLQKNPDILYNYVTDDLLSPATVRNTYSKTVSLPSTARNRRVFGHIFQGDEVDGFDASKKVEFTLYPGVGHNSWTVTYNNRDLYTWFLRQSR